jgi:hypothetical protein
MPSPRRWWMLRTLGLAAPSYAQTTIDVGPLFGYYEPLGHFDPASVYSTSLPSTPRELRGFAWGGAAHVSFGRRLGAEGRVSVANSTLPVVITPGGPREPIRAQEVVWTLQGQYDLSPAPEKYRVWLSAGPGLVRHGGDAYARYGSPVSVGGALGLGVAVPVASRVRIVADVTTLLYSLDVAMPPEWQANPGSLQHGSQRDALIQLGARWRLP